MKYDILITGVGGQGQVLASRLLGAAAIACGQSVRTGETIGMAQRGGCVVSNVRIGDEVRSPSVPDGQADLIIGFELCETVRSLKKLRPGGRVLLNSHIISPITVSLGMQQYDAAAMLDYIKSHVDTLLIIDGMQLALQAGSVKACNTVLLGAAAGAGFLPFPAQALADTISANVPAKYRELNSKAFEAGRSFAQENHPAVR